MRVFLLVPDTVEVIIASYALLLCQRSTTEAFFLTKFIFHIAFVAVNGSKIYTEYFMPSTHENNRFVSNKILDG